MVSLGTTRRDLEEPKESCNRVSVISLDRSNKIFTSLFTGINSS